MKRLAFLDIGFHQQTRSTHFIADLLREQFEVDVFYIDKHRGDYLNLVADSAYEYVVCCEAEFVAHYLIARGKRVILIPMFDGCEWVADRYWRGFRQAC